MCACIHINTLMFSPFELKSKEFCGPSQGKRRMMSIFPGTYFSSNMKERFHFCIKFDHHLPFWFSFLFVRFRLFCFFLGSLPVAEKRMFLVYVHCSFFPPICVVYVLVPCIFSNLISTKQRDRCEFYRCRQNRKSKKRILFLEKIMTTMETK